jgi:monofunctional biosynthetic peptidoglycan transglycosylase
VRILRRLVQALAILVAVIVLLPLGCTLIYRAVPPPGTPLMAIRLFEGYGWSRDWVALDDISGELPLAVIASEDNRFCQHGGFDLEQIRRAWLDFQAGGRLRGASTITMQVARNLYLWPGGGFARKGLEALYASYLELILPKWRIMELYLNIAEWGPGLYGAEAAAQDHFGVPAAELTGRQAALLAAALPSPLTRDPGAPSASLLRRAGQIQTQMANVAPIVDCLE